jgi:hypothetical protein
MRGWIHDQSKILIKFFLVSHGHGWMFSQKAKMIGLRHDDAYSPLTFIPENIPHQNYTKIIHVRQPAGIRNCQPKLGIEISPTLRV